MKYYLAGPMTGIEKFNFPLFHSAAAALRAKGYEIISPAEVDGPEIAKEANASADGKLDANGKIAGHTWGDLLSRDVKIVADEVDGIVFLPGWEKSRGARLEAFTALLCGHKFMLWRMNGNEMTEIETTSDYVRGCVWAST